MLDDGVPGSPGALTVPVGGKLVLESGSVVVAADPALKSIVVPAGATLETPEDCECACLVCPVPATRLCWFALQASPVPC